MLTLNIIAGCNGAGKATAAQTLLPLVFESAEFVNADNEWDMQMDKLNLPLWKTPKH